MFVTILKSLSLDLWLEWIRDEIKLGTTDEDKEKIELLFKRATQDYLSMFYISIIYNNLIYSNILF